MKLGHIVDENFKLSVLKLLQQPTPVKTTLLLDGIVNLLNREIEQYNTAKQELLEKFGRKDDAGQLVTDENRNVQFTEENALAFNTAHNDLLTKEVEVPSLSVSDLGDKVTMSYEDLVKLGGFILR